MLTYAHYLNPIIEAMKDFRRTPEANYLLKNDLTKTERIFTDIVAHVKKFTAEEVAKYIKSSEPNSNKTQFRCIKGRLEVAGEKPKRKS